MIATPNDSHKELVIRGLLSGHNVICEKPATLSVDEFDSMVEAERESGKCLAVHQNRTIEAYEVPIPKSDVHSFIVIFVERLINKKSSVVSGSYIPN